MSQDPPNITGERLLLVDLGNTRCKWRWQGPGQQCRGSLASDSLDATGLQHGWRDLEPPNRLLMANVLGNWAQQLVREQAWQLWRVEPEWVRAERRALGVTNRYLEPERLGSDRWAGMIAARKAFPLGCLLVDCGTAATIDLLDREGQHRLALILPGLRQMNDCLLHGTRITDQGPPGKDTMHAIALGGRTALLGAIERIHRQGVRETGQALPLILSGGDAEQLSAELDLPFTLWPELVLDGLECIAQHANPLAQA